jgi:ferredoxin
MDRKKFFKHGIAKLFSVVEKVSEMKDKIPEIIQKELPPIEIEPVIEEKVNKILPKFTNKLYKHKGLKHPPGSGIDRKKFESICTGCGDCIRACPYRTIFPLFNSKLEKNIPNIDPNFRACMLCKDYPCIRSCKPKALRPLKKKELPKLGQAKSLFDHCSNSKLENDFCNICKNICPVENVISFKKNGKPKFSSECTGCGICVASCPNFPKAIVIK